MPALRFALTLALGVALGVVLSIGGASAAGAAATTTPRPTGLKAFLLTTNEPASHVFSRTPSFAWRPVKGAIRYEFQLSTTMRFNDVSIVWSNVAGTTQLAPDVAPEPGAAAPATTQQLPEQLKVLRSPALALDVALPWVTGEPYSLYARVRAVLRQGASRWSTPYGFNVRWTDVAQPMSSPPGLLRWAPVDGATSYAVWIYGAHRLVHTTSNVVDLRELYNFHQTPAWINTVHWRVRAERQVYGQSANGLPATSHGPWSPVYVNHNPNFVSGGPIKLSQTISDTVTTASGGRLHRLTPAFSWTGTFGNASGFAANAELWRVYIATDRDCVNIVYRGVAVGSPAYAPRALGTLGMPHDVAALEKASDEVLDIGSEGDALRLDGDPVDPDDDGKTVTTGNETTVTFMKTDLWDNSWPNGGYYWTVVPVVLESTGALAGGTSSGFLYRDAELPEDACRSGRVMRFGKTSDTVITRQNAPYATGMSTRGLLSSAQRPKPTFYGAPLVAWQPALGAEEYEVQWSKSGYPFKPVATPGTITGATSLVLPLTPGRWWYRVRGLNRDAISKPEMAWSAPVHLDIARPVFSVGH